MRSSITVRLDPADDEIVDELIRLLRASGPSDMTRRCWLHTLETIRRGEPVHGYVSGEVGQRKPKPKPPEERS